MAADLRKKLLPGTRIRVTQQIAVRDHSYAAVVEGTIIRYDQRPTGSWYAHSRDDKLWLDRVELKKADGEVSLLNLDDYSQVEILAAAPTPTPDPADVS